MPQNPDDRAALVQHWLDAVAREPVRAALEGVYLRAAEYIARRGPACWASGRCCSFETAGHRLYVTGIEAAYCLSRLPEIAGVRPENIGEPMLRPLALASARARGGCPFQVRNLCGVHAIKPLGCRLYFCDRSAQQWQNELSEKLLGEIRDLHDVHGVEYRYGEWCDLLAMFIEQE